MMSYEFVVTMNFSDSNEIIPSMNQSLSERFLSSDELKMTEAAGRTYCHKDCQSDIFVISYEFVVSMNFSDSNEIIPPSMDQSLSQRFLSSGEPKMTEDAGMPTEGFSYTEEIAWKDTRHLSLSSALSSVDVDEVTSISERFSLKQSISKPILSKDGTLSVSYKKTDSGKPQSLSEGHMNGDSLAQSHGESPVSAGKTGHESLPDVDLLSSKFSSPAHRSFSGPLSSRDIASVDVGKLPSINKGPSLKQSKSSRDTVSVRVDQLASNSNYLSSRHVISATERAIDLSMEETLAVSPEKRDTGEDTITCLNDSLIGNTTLQQVSGSDKSETYGESEEEEPFGGSGEDAVKMEKRESTSLALITVTVIAMLVFCVTEFYLLTKEDKYALQQDKSVIASASGSM
jgi:hypothetical protein